MPTAMNCLGGINTLTKLFRGFTKWLWQAKMFLVDGRTCSHPLPSLSNLWSFIYDVCKKNKALNQGARAVKATPLLSHKCRDIIPAIKPFPLSQPQGKPSQVFCCSFSSAYDHTSGGAEKKGGKLSTKWFSNTQGSPLTCYIQLCATVITAAEHKPSASSRGGVLKPWSLYGQCKTWALMSSLQLGASPVTVCTVISPSAKLQAPEGIFLG